MILLCKKKKFELLKLTELGQKKLSNLIKPIGIAAASGLVLTTGVMGVPRVDWSGVHLQTPIAQAADQTLNRHERGDQVDLVTPQIFSPGEEVKAVEFFINQQSGQMQAEGLSTVRADSGGAARLRYTLPLNQLKGSIQIQFTNGKRQFVIAVPIGRTTAPAPVEQANFPMQFGSGDAEVAHKFWMRTNVKVEKTATGGLLSATTVGWNRNRLQGYTVGVEVALLDKNDNVLFVSPLRKWGINGTAFPGRDSFTSNWSESLPPDVVANVRKIGILQRHTPTNRLPGVLKKLQEIKQIVQAIQQAILVVSSLL